MTTEEKLKLVGKFDGWIINANGTVSNLKWNDKFQGEPDEFKHEILAYAREWNWQIPVWAKLVDLDKEDGRATMGVIKLGKYHDYYQSVSDNNPAAGFEIIVQIIQRI